MKEEVKTISYEVIQELSKMFPNDQEFGREVRKLLNSNEKEKVTNN